jgi:diadenosine tetraphosphate (Ap4A) HIT family hydrolase
MFALDERIASSSMLVTELPLCQIRLQNDQRFPWLVLIPKVADAVEVTDLSGAQQVALIQESSRVSTILQQITQCKKINVANLGNVVAQLHWHVVARFPDDEAWPGPVWGVGEAKPWQEQQRDELIATLQIRLST